jgi:hypothetical protein
MIIPVLFMGISSRLDTPIESRRQFKLGCKTSWAHLAFSFAL